SDGAIFGLYAGCSPAKAGEVTRLLLEELDKVAQAGISEEELTLAKGNISGSLALKFESTQARMSRLASSEITNGEFVDLDTTLERFESVTIQDVQRLAAELAGRERSIVAVGDLKEKTFEPFAR
ncbi:MAG: insulinase family protein, partial [Actinomycetes bacterium]